MKLSLSMLNGLSKKEKMPPRRTHIQPRAIGGRRLPGREREECQLIEEGAAVPRFSFHAMSMPHNATRVKRGKPVLMCSAEVHCPPVMSVTRERPYT